MNGLSGSVGRPRVHLVTFLFVGPGVGKQKKTCRNCTKDILGPLPQSFPFIGRNGKKKKRNGPKTSWDQFVVPFLSFAWSGPEMRILGSDAILLRSYYDAIAILLRSYYDPIKILVRCNHDPVTVLLRSDYDIIISSYDPITILFGSY